MESDKSFKIVILAKTTQLEQGTSTTYTAMSKYSSLIEFYLSMLVSVAVAIFLDSMLKPNPQYGLYPLISLAYLLIPTGIALLTQENTPTRTLFMIYLRGVFLAPVVAYYGMFSGNFHYESDIIFAQPDQFLMSFGNILLALFAITLIYGAYMTVIGVLFNFIIPDFWNYFNYTYT